MPEESTRGLPKTLCVYMLKESQEVVVDVDVAVGGLGNGKL